MHSRPVPTQVDHDVGHPLNDTNDLWVVSPFIRSECRFTFVVAQQAAGAPVDKRRTPEESDSQHRRRST